eukprot:m.149806 g.149806  ORF g.149806 m.149806 type:complete len:121 (+) comp15019_c2_seq5:318-680(+)
MRASKNPPPPFYSRFKARAQSNMENKMTLCYVGRDGVDIGTGTRKDGMAYRYSGEVKNRRAEGVGVQVTHEGRHTYYGHFQDGKLCLERPFIKKSGSMAPCPCNIMLLLLLLSFVVVVQL